MCSVSSKERGGNGESCHQGLYPCHIRYFTCMKIDIYRSQRPLLGFWGGRRSISFISGENRVGGYCFRGNEILIDFQCDVIAVITEMKGKVYCGISHDDSACDQLEFVSDSKTTQLRSKEGRVLGEISGHLGLSSDRDCLLKSDVGSIRSRMPSGVEYVRGLANFNLYFGSVVDGEVDRYLFILLCCFDVMFHPTRSTSCS